MRARVRARGLGQLPASPWSIGPGYSAATLLLRVRIRVRVRVRVRVTARIRVRISVRLP